MGSPNQMCLGRRAQAAGQEGPEMLQMLPPIAKERGPSERPFYSNSQTKPFTVEGWEVVGKEILQGGKPRKYTWM